MKNDIRRKIMSRVKNIHFIGIGGSGMSGIALILNDLGYTISGSDISASKTTDFLKKKNIKVYIGHKKNNVFSKNVVVVSSAIKDSNVEYVHAKKLNIPVIQRAEMLAELMRYSYGIAIAGTHGKTSTTALLSYILGEAKYDPTYIIGGKIINYSNAKLGSSDYLIAEADESDASFLHLQPMISVITNIDKDHLENHQGSFCVLKKNFVKFVNNMPFYGLCLINKSDINTMSLINDLARPIKTFGIDVDSDYKAISVDVSKSMAEYTYIENDKRYKIKLNVSGKHNVLNSLAALSVARELNIPIKVIQNALINFPGVSRRLEIIGYFTIKEKKFMWIDDYGHHPTEIKAVINAIKNIWANREIIIIFEPHRYSRVAEHFDQFVDVLQDVDRVILMNIYAASETKIKNISSAIMIKEISRYNKKAKLLNSHEEISDFIDKTISSDDILLTMGAGDILKFVNFYKKKLSKN